MHEQLEPADEWGHLIPLALTIPESVNVNTYERVYKLCRWVAQSIHSHKSNLRNYYRFQYALYGTLRAVKNTTSQSGRVLCRMLTGRRRYVATKLRFRPAPRWNKLQFCGSTDDWSQDGVQIEDVTISVIIPTKNAGADLRSLLSMLQNQKGFKSIEIIIVDSGSSDLTLEIAREFSAKVIELLPEEFSHSYARNLGAQHSTGDCILFTVQDALPPSLTWLRELYRPIQSLGVIASSCVESPRLNSDLLYRALCWNHYGFLNAQAQDRILKKPWRNDYESLRTNANVSNIACLIKRDVFFAYKFRGDYGEDLDLGLRLIRAGYKMAMLSSTRIIHSHNRPAYYHLQRGYVDKLFMLKLFPDHEGEARDASVLMDEILSVYKLLNMLFATHLAQSVKSYSMDALCKTVMDALAVPGTENAPVQVAKGSNLTDDSRFESFIANVYERHDCSHGSRMTHAGSLLSSFRSFIGTMLQYMQSIYDVLDEPLLDDFRKSLVKAFALVCGVHLAVGVMRGSPATKNVLLDICTDFRASI
jgi:glycosyltransferase involved in cell wall biosynthesis